MGVKCGVLMVKDKEEAEAAQKGFLARNN